MTVTLFEIMAAAQCRRAAMAAETAGSVVLAIADQLLPVPCRIVAADVTLGPEGAFGVHRPVGGSEAECEGALRSLLARLLELSRAAAPSLARVGRREARGNLIAFVRELEAAMIPVNRSAGRRALGRLHRETMRAIEGGIPASAMTAAQGMAAAMLQSREVSEAPSAVAAPSPRQHATPSLGRVESSPRPSPARAVRDVAAVAAELEPRPEPGGRLTEDVTERVPMVMADDEPSLVVETTEVLAPAVQTSVASWVTASSETEPALRLEVGEQTARISLTAPLPARFGRLGLTQVVSAAPAPVAGASEPVEPPAAVAPDIEAPAETTAEVPPYGSDEAEVVGEVAVSPVAEAPVSPVAVAPVAISPAGLPVATPPPAEVQEAPEVITARLPLGRRTSRPAPMALAIPPQGGTRDPLPVLVAVADGPDDAPRDGSADASGGGLPVAPLSAEMSAEPLAEEACDGSDGLVGASWSAWETDLPVPVEAERDVDPLEGVPVEGVLAEACAALADSAESEPARRPTGETPRQASSWRVKPAAGVFAPLSSNVDDLLARFAIGALPAAQVEHGLAEFVEGEHSPTPGGVRARPALAGRAASRFSIRRAARPIVVPAPSACDTSEATLAWPVPVLSKSGR